MTKLRSYTGDSVLMIKQFRHVTIRCHGNGRCPRQSSCMRVRDAHFSSAALYATSKYVNSKFAMATICRPTVASLTHFGPQFRTWTVEMDARLANRPFLIFDFRALYRSGLSASVLESQKLKTVIESPN